MKNLAIGLANLTQNETKIVNQKPVFPMLS